MDEIAALLTKLCRLLRSRGRNADDTDDLIQDAFVRLAVYCQDHTVEKKEAFLVRTLLNLSIDKRIRDQRSVTEPIDKEALLVIDPRPSPDALYEGEKRLLHWEAGLRTLSPRQREVLLLNRVEGYAFPQIAQRLGISLSMVEKHAAKATLYMTDWMENE